MRHPKDPPFVTFVIHADTPDDLRRELQALFAKRQMQAGARAAVPNQSSQTRQTWLQRARIAGELSHFLRELRIEPKATDPLNQPEN